jgi:hypothetical protein
MFMLWCFVFVASVMAALEPWQVTALRTYSPPYSPNVTLKSGIAFTISDPNTMEAGPAHRGPAIFPPSTANCSGSWTDEVQAYDRLFNCTEVQYGYWSFELRKPVTGYASPMTNFDVRIQRVYNVTVMNSVYTKILVAPGHFEVGKNMGGLCGASGVCSFQLKGDSAPSLVMQEVVACSGAC